MCPGTSSPGHLTLLSEGGVSDAYKKRKMYSPPTPHITIREQDDRPLFCVVSCTNILHQTLIRMDSCSLPQDWKKAWNYLSREVSSPKNCWNCRMDEQKIADDKFFRTTLYVPVVADCEIMCWPFWEHALLIRVCLVVYKKLIIPSPHCHRPIPHLLKKGQPPSNPVLPMEGLAPSWKGTLAGSHLCKLVLWVGAGRCHRTQGL